MRWPSVTTESTLDLRRLDPLIRAILWDVDGTLAETERDGHRVAFHQAFEALQVPWRWSEERYGELLAVAGGRTLEAHRSEANQPVVRALRGRSECASRSGGMIGRKCER
jgi:phosphoglycolate phosphatase-like HAD superfamily hydrolase